MLAVFWPARRDSNPRPSESESAAISSFATGGCADIIAQKKAGSKSGGRAAQKYFFDGQQNWKKLLQKSEVSLIIYELLIFSATVAQLVEQLIRNQQVAGSSPATSSINRAGFRLVILRGLFLCFLYKNSSALLCFSQQGACFVDYSFVFSVSGASSAEVFFAWGWGSSFTTGIKRLANLFLPRLRT